MKFDKLNIKRVVKKKIELRNGIGYLQSKKNVKTGVMDDRTKVRLGLLNRIPSRIIKPVLINHSYNNIIVKEYNKKIFVDYDVVICIPSYNRYNKIKRLLNQFYTQKTKYTIKIILLNDGSTDKRYDDLSNNFSEITYIKNDKPNGKIKHWYCYSQMWNELKNIECHAVLQMDDDFILCDNFLNIVVDEFFVQKEKNDNMRGIALHTWSFCNFDVKYEEWWNNIFFVDGICLLDFEVIKQMNYVMQPVDNIVKNPGMPVRTWTQISFAVKNNGGYFFRTPESLVYHDGNNDSKLHGNVRGNGKGVFTQRLCNSLNKYKNG